MLGFTDHFRECWARPSGSRDACTVTAVQLARGMAVRHVGQFVDCFNHDGFDNVEINGNCVCCGCCGGGSGPSSLSSCLLKMPTSQSFDFERVP